MSLVLVLHHHIVLLAGFNTVHGDIYHLESLGEIFNIWFMFDSAFEPSLMEKLGALWNASKGAEMLICFRTLEQLQAFGFKDLVFQVLN